MHKQSKRFKQCKQYQQYPAIPSNTQQVQHFGQYQQSSNTSNASDSSGFSLVPAEWVQAAATCPFMLRKSALAEQAGKLIMTGGACGISMPRVQGAACGREMAAVNSVACTDFEGMLCWGEGAGRGGDWS